MNFIQVANLTSRTASSNPEQLSSPDERSSRDDRAIQDFATFMMNFGLAAYWFPAFAGMTAVLN